jgi:glycosyltransferase involved in cell wall biosynthesis
MALPRVAFDVGPLLGRRTGVGTAVTALRDGLSASSEVELMPYILSFRGRPQSGVRRLALPAALAHRCWAVTDRPRFDRSLKGAALIHGTNYVVPPSRLPRVVSVYDCWFLRNPGAAHSDVVRAGKVLGRALRSGAVAHASSTATADGIRELFPTAEVRTVPLGAIELPAPPSACPIPELDGLPFIVSISTIERRKNIPALIDAFGAVSSQHPDLRLVIAGGNGDDIGAVTAALDRLPLHAGGRVLLTGFVDDGVRSWLLHHTMGLCYPSLDEGFGFPLLDAMQAGAPIVATRAGSIPEVAGDAALLVDVGDADALAGSISRIVSDTALREQLVAAGTRQLDRFTWARTTQLITELYLELAAGNP